MAATAALEGAGRLRHRQSLDYSLKRWVALTRYLDDGDLPANKKWAENQIRPIAIGRNNWRFAGCGYEFGALGEAERA